MKASQYYCLLLNGTPIGILQDFEETLEREIKQQRSFRSNAVTFVQHGAQTYALQFKRLLVPLCLPGDLEQLHQFTLTLECEEHTICYTGCEFSRLSTKTDSAGTMIEEAKIYASERSVTEQ